MLHQMQVLLTVKQVTRQVCVLVHAVRVKCTSHDLLSAMSPMELVVWPMRTAAVR